MSRRLAPWLAICAGIACASPPRPGASEPRPEPRTTTARDDVPSLVPGEPLGDALWQRAAGGEPMDLQRLADREGAGGLWVGVSRGGTQGLTALAALPYAEDGELALGALCRLAGRLEDPGRHRALRALRGIVAHMAPDRERLGAEAFAGCSQVLARLAESPALPPGDRDLASSTRADLLEYLKPE